jgi:23S rRNA pseudouridine2605 synthase
MRLNRFLASAGLGSRRGVEDLVRSGSITVNGRTCTDLATQIGERDSVKANGHLLRPEKQLNILLYKPVGYLSTASDPEERRTIVGLLPAGWPRLFHVGRLDKESEGLLILTNDGDLSLRLTHPRYKVEKEYEVTLDRPFDVRDRDALLKGMHIGGAEEGSGWAKAEEVHRVTPQKLRIVLRQGLKRQIRLMLRELDYEVQKLVRIRIGSVELADMQPGEWRPLTEKEVAKLKGGASEKHLSASPGPRGGHPHREREGRKRGVQRRAIR